MLTGDLVQYFRWLQKNSFVKMLGGGVHGSHKSKCYRLPIYMILFHMIISELLAILDPKMVSIVAFSNYVDVKQI